MKSIKNFLFVSNVIQKKDIIQLLMIILKIIFKVDMSNVIMKKQSQIMYILIKIYKSSRDVMNLVKLVLVMVIQIIIIVLLVRKDIFLNQKFQIQKIV